MAERDDFSRITIHEIGGRASYLCAFPQCGRRTLGPSEDRENGLSNLGVAAHIVAASAGGPRYDGALTSQQRADAENGIWLCQNHAKWIDDNPSEATVSILREWKARHEAQMRDYLKLESPQDQREMAIAVDILPGLSRVITGDMIRRGGNYIDGCEFAFTLGFDIIAHQPGTLTSINCNLYRERWPVSIPEGMDTSLLSPEEFEALPTYEVKDFARNMTPGILSGAYGLGGQVGISSPGVLLNGEFCSLRDDLKSFSKRPKLGRYDCVILEYSRLCKPAADDEQPCDYIYRASLLCELGFRTTDEASAKIYTFKVAYSKGGRASLNAPLSV